MRVDADKQRRRIMASREQLLALYRGLRVTDVCDGLDSVGLIDATVMDWEIRPLWRDVESFSHRICGFAHTVRFVPTDRVVQRPLPVEEYKKWKSEWYGEISAKFRQYPIQQSDVLVFDAQGVATTGFIGSNNAFGWINQGAVGMVTNGGCRDTDEIIKERIPVYHRIIARGIRPGRLQWDAQMVPVTCGGVYVRPGDLVVADGDGVIVVPIEHAEAVGEFAREVANDDKRSRKRHYQLAGLEPDWTVQPLE
jgi:4-hydroxy-4-methyl-2-oxoglutarate aldolase